MNNNHKFATFYVAFISVALAGALYANSLNSPKVFVFTWSKEEQDIVNGILRMEISFNWKNESLNIVAKINQEQPLGSFLGLVFDKNGNGSIDYDDGDEPYMFIWNNMSVTHDVYLRSDNHLMSPANWEVGLYHNCTFIEGVGYQYNITIPKSELATVKANTVMIIYEGGTYYEPPAGPRHADWVTALAEGWQ